RPLSPPAPMVLRPQGLGRVGRRQAREAYRIYAVGFLFYPFFILISIEICINGLQRHQANRK
ncbi:hypothetical protein, partial [Paenibacillus sinopodophylli]|uniref:hypothetical protein n=1 Tax=Paenibacillus sinopodophylli TaxID=1837342 RepID=UPI001BB0F4D5